MCEESLDEINKLYGFTPNKVFEWASARGRHNEALLRSLALLDDFVPQDALIGACEIGNDFALALVLELGADVNRLDAMGRLPLVHILPERHLEFHESCLKLLLKAKPDIHLPDGNGETALGLFQELHAKQIFSDEIAAYFATAAPNNGSVKVTG